MAPLARDRKSTRLNSSHLGISYAVFCLKKRGHSRYEDDAAGRWPPGHPVGRSRCGGRAPATPASSRPPPPPSPTLCFGPPFSLSSPPPPRLPPFPPRAPPPT